MHNHLLFNGIAVVIKFCSDNRIPETGNKYQIACEYITTRYADHGNEYYSQYFNEELRQEVKARLEGQPANKLQKI